MLPYGIPITLSLARSRVQAGCLIIRLYISGMRKPRQLGGADSARRANRFTNAVTRLWGKCLYEKIYKPLWKHIKPIWNIYNGFDQFFNFITVKPDILTANSLLYLTNLWKAWYWGLFILMVYSTGVYFNIYHLWMS
jgi:hypothetical protein